MFHQISVSDVLQFLTPFLIGDSFLRSNALLVTGISNTMTSLADSLFPLCTIDDVTPEWFLLFHIHCPLRVKIQHPSTSKPYAARGNKKRFLTAVLVASLDFFWDLCCAHHHDSGSHISSVLGVKTFESVQKQSLNCNLCSRIALSIIILQTL